MPSARIKSIRKLHKLSQQSFGEKLGVSRDVINNIENGRVEPTELIIKAISNEFKISYLWLKDGIGEQYDSPGDDLTVLVDEIINSDNEFAKGIFKAFTKFSESDWIALEKIVDKISAETKKEPTE